MVSGFNLFDDKDKKLVFALKNSDRIEFIKDIDVEKYLIIFSDLDFDEYDVFVSELYDAPLIFALDDDEPVRFDPSELSDEDIIDICEDAPSYAPDKITKFFLELGLNILGNANIKAKSKAKEMVALVEFPLDAYSFVNHTFDLLYGDTSEEDFIKRLNNFLKLYPAIYANEYLEFVDFLPNEDGKLDTDNAIEFINDALANKADLFASLHKDKHGLQVVKGYTIHSQIELMNFCVVELLRKNPSICRCEYCRRYFVPKTKKKTLYCDRVIKNGKTCKEVAPKEKQRRTTQADDILQEYERLCNLYYSRAERYDGRRDYDRKRRPKDLTMRQYYIWSRQASEIRVEYLNGEISGEDFIYSITLEEYN